MMKEIKFTKLQCEALKKIFIDANKSFDKSLAEKPYLYHEYERDVFLRGYVEAGLENIINDGFAYLEV